MKRALLLVVVGAACVRYRAAPFDLPAAASPAPPPSPLSFDAAVRVAVERNPELLALRARAASVATRVPAEPLELEAGWDNARVAEATIAMDALSLLGVGRRGAERALARARRDEAWMRHHERARAIAGEIGEAFAAEAALAALTLPEVPFDPARYVRAGLAPASAEAVARASRAALEAERARRESERLRARATLLRLLGAAPGAPLELSLPEAPWPPPAPAEPLAVLRARADLQRGLAEYEVAEAAFRRAAAEQYPALVLAPGVGGDPLGVFGAVGVKLPVGAGPAARAAASARDAAGFELRAAVLRALEEAETARAEADAAARRLEAARARAEAQRALLRTAAMELETREGSFLETALAVQGVVDAAREEREAALDEVAARFRAARACGWPPPLD